MTNLERIMKNLNTTIGKQQMLGKKRKARKSTRLDGTNPRAKKITSTETKTKTVLVENFDAQDWDEILSLEERWGYDYE